MGAESQREESLRSYLSVIPRAVRTLDLNFSTVDDELPKRAGFIMAEALANLQHLVELRFELLSGDTMEDALAPLYAVSKVANLHQLEIRTGECELHKAVALGKALGGMGSRLEVVTLSIWPDIEEKGMLSILKGLAELPNLKHLKLSYGSLNVEEREEQAKFQLPAGDWSSAEKAKMKTVIKGLIALAEAFSSSGLRSLETLAVSTCFREKGLRQAFEDVLRDAIAQKDSKVKVEMTPWERNR